MRVTVNTHPQDFLDKQEVHRLSEGIPVPLSENVNLSGVKNVEYVREAVLKNGEWTRNKRDYFEYPSVRVTDFDGKEFVFHHARVDLSETEPDVEVYEVENVYGSEDVHRLTRYDAHGIQYETYTDSFGHENGFFSIIMCDSEGRTLTFVPHGYRGFLVKYPDEITIHGDVSRFGLKGQKRGGPRDVQRHPFSTPEGTFSVRADGQRYTSIDTIARRNTIVRNELVFDIHTTIGNKITVSRITDVKGPLYTVCARHDSTFGDGETVTSINRSLGVYVDEVPSFSGEPIVYAVGHPQQRSVYRTPQLHRICKKSQLKNIHVKTPTGKILNSVDELPHYDFTQFSSPTPTTKQRI